MFPTRHPLRGARALVVTGAAALVLLGLTTTDAMSTVSSILHTGDSATTSVRKDVKDLTKAEKSAFVAAVLKAKRTPDPSNPGSSYYDTFVEWHRDAFLCENSWDQGDNWAGAAHNSPTFLPWHRQYLIEYEAMLRTVSGDPTMTLPYWDWTDAESTAAVFSPDFMGGQGDPAADYAVTDGPFRKGEWKVTITDPAVLQKGMVPQPSYLVRRFGTFFGNPIGLPTAQDVRWAIKADHYDHAPYNADSPLPESFRNRLEGWRDAVPGTCVDGWNTVNEAPGSPHALHNAVHLFVGGVWNDGPLVAQGTMAYNTSPNDPVFFLHHANIDRIFAAWELASAAHYRPRGGAEYGWNATDTMWPWHDRTINSWFGTLRNGYLYASLPD